MQPESPKYELDDEKDSVENVERYVGPGGKWSCKVGWAG